MLIVSCWGQKTLAYRRWSSVELGTEAYFDSGQSWHNSRAAATAVVSNETNFLLGPLAVVLSGLAWILHPFRREALVTNIAELSPFVARHVRSATAGVFFTH